MSWARRPGADGGGGTAPDAAALSTKAANTGTSFSACQLAMPDVKTSVLRSMLPFRRFARISS